MNTLRKFINFRRSSSCSWRSSSSQPSSFKSFVRALVAASLSSCAVAGGAAALATQPPLASTIFLPPPPLAATPLGRSLSGAYGAIVRASAANPAAAAQANFAYVQALQRARMGNVAGALAAAHLAQATAQSPVVPSQVALPATPAPGPLPVAAALAGVPIVENGDPLSPQLIVARNEIELASRVARAPLEAAKAHYRAALDAYVSGNAPRSRSEARAAFDAAADALATAK